MTIFKNIKDGKLYTIYRNNDGTYTAFPSGKVTKPGLILKDCELADFVVEKLEKHNIKGFL
jgi:hypothetical protein